MDREKEEGAAKRSVRFPKGKFEARLLVAGLAGSSRTRSRVLWPLVSTSAFEPRTTSEN